LILEAESHEEEDRHPSDHLGPARRINLRSVLKDVFPVWLALAVLTSLPYLLALERTPAGHRFSGVLTAYDDTFTYFAWIRQAAAGRLLMCDLYTSEPQSCVFFLPLWSFLGFIVRLTGLPIPVVFHVARLLSALLLLWVARIVASGAFKSRGRMRWTLWLYAFSGGLGWVVYLVNKDAGLFDSIGVSGSADLNLPEAFAFRSAFAQVHFTLGAAMVCGALYLFFRGLRDHQTSPAAWAGVLVALLAVVHPYLVVVVAVVGGVMLVAWPWLARQSNLRSAYASTIAPMALFGICCAPGIAYLFYLNRSNKVLQEWLRITNTLSPSPAVYLLGFGLVGGLAILGAPRMLKDHRASARAMVLWMLTQTLLLYAPVNFQRRLVEGLQLPLTLAASVMVSYFLSSLRHRRGLRRAILILILFVASATNVALLVGQSIARGPATGATDPRRYLPDSLDQSLEWLRLNGEPESVVMCSYLTGNLLPGETGLTVFLGHYGQTVHSGQKRDLVNRFFAGEMTDLEAREVSARNGIKYVLYGPFERRSSGAFKGYSFMRPLEAFGDVEIYAVDFNQK
jgi:hypothetical protein